jgi:hypothetical protein
MNVAKGGAGKVCFLTIVNEIACTVHVCREAK